MGIAVVIINLFVIPAFAKAYKSMHAKLPLMTQLLIDFSNFMVDFWPVILLGAIGAFFGFRAWTKRPAGRLVWDAFKLKIPIAGKIVLKATLARFGRGRHGARHRGHDAGSGSGPRTADDTDPTIDLDEQRVALDEACELLAATGAEVDVIATVGNPADEILRAAEKLTASS